MPIEDPVTLPEAAAALGVSARAVARLVRDGEVEQRDGGVAAESLRAHMARANLSPCPPDHPAAGRFDGPVALSFFTGAMGLDLGMEQAGIHARLYCENERKCRMTIGSARPDAALVGDVASVEAGSVLSMAGITDGHVDVMFGGPPCQAFSTAGSRRAFADERGNSFLKYLDLVGQIRPTYVVVENVRGLLSAAWPAERGVPAVRGGAMALVLSRLASMGYAVSFNLYNAADFGAPQVRERVVLVGRLGARKVAYLAPTNSRGGAAGLPAWRTFGQAVTPPPEGCRCSRFPERRLGYLRMLGPGQCWRDLPEGVRREAMGKSYSLPGGKTGFYRRLSFDRPCPTLVTSPTMPATCLCHPVEDRPLSVEEYMRVQGFPDGWPVRGDLADQYRQLGNAVPVALGRAIGEAIMADMEGRPPDPRLECFRYSRYRHTSDRDWARP